MADDWFKFTRCQMRAMELIRRLRNAGIEPETWLETQIARLPEQPPRRPSSTTTARVRLTPPDPTPRPAELNVSKARDPRRDP